MVSCNNRRRCLRFVIPFVVPFVIPTGVIQMTEWRNLIDPSTEPAVSRVGWLWMTVGNLKVRHNILKAYRLSFKFSYNFVSVFLFQFVTAESGVFFNVFFKIRKQI